MRIFSIVPRQFQRPATFPLVFYNVNISTITIIALIMVTVCGYYQHGVSLLQTDKCVPNEVIISFPLNTFRTGSGWPDNSKSTVRGLPDLVKCTTSGKTVIIGVHFFFSTAV